MSTNGNGNGSHPLNPTVRERAWFCVRTRPKSEHIAAAHLRDLEAVEVFNPRIRFKRPRKGHTMWVTEALFPGYIFAKFNWMNSLKTVFYTNGVTGIVHFGEQWPIIDDEVVLHWREKLGEDELAVCEEMPETGEEVLITTGAFKGMIAEVVKVSSSRRRIAVLMDFLGRQMQVELKADQYSRTNARDKISIPPSPGN